MDNSKLNEFLKRYKTEKLAIVTHNKADPDALASAYAIHKQLPNSIICSHEEMKYSAKLLAEKFNIKIHSLDTLNREEWAGLVVVDTSSYTLVPQAKDWNIKLIIDHHQDDGRDMDAEIMIIDKEAASAAEIVSSLIKDIDKESAFLLAVAIISDGARFKSARKESFEQLARLMNIAGADYAELLKYAEPELPLENKLQIFSTAKKAETHIINGYLVATAIAESNESDISSFLTEIVDIAFVARRKENKSRVSARARKNVHIGMNEVMGEVAKKLGGAGGGHAKAAGAAVDAMPEIVIESCLETLQTISMKK